MDLHNVFDAVFYVQQLARARAHTHTHTHARTHAFCISLYTLLTSFRLCASLFISEWVSEWVNEWVSVSEKVIRWVSERASTTRSIMLRTEHRRCAQKIRATVRNYQKRPILPYNPGRGERDRSVACTQRSRSPDAYRKRNACTSRHD